MSVRSLARVALSRCSGAGVRRGARPLRSMARAVSASAEQPEGASGGAADEQQARIERLQAVLAKAQAHNDAAARPSVAEVARTMVSGGGYGVLCTNASSKALEGYPAGSVAGFAAAAEDGMPIFAFSSMSGHTGDLREDGRCSMVVQAAPEGGADSARVTLTGMVEEITDATAAAACRETYLGVHKDAFWVDFGDFAWFRMTSLAHCRWIGGFGRAHTVKPETYTSASPDPVNPFSGPVCSHMNDDHADATKAIVAKFAGIEGLDAARMLCIDRLGMDVSCELEGESFDVRIAWTEPAEGRKDVKDRIVELTKAAA